jgi:phasin family protein
MAKANSNQKNTEDFAAFGADMLKKSTEAFKKSAEQFKDFKVPGIDKETLQASHRKNMDLLMAAQHTAIETMKTLGKLQSEFMKSSIEAMTSTVKTVASTKDKAEKLDTQTETLKKTIEKATNHSQEISKVLAKGQGEIIDLMQRRACEAVDEAREIQAKASTTK